MNKIIANWGDCNVNPSVVNNLYILYSTNNLNYQVFPGWVLDKTFNYKLCFSQDSTNYEKWSWVEIELNRNRLNEYFFETLENY